MKYLITSSLLLFFIVFSILFTRDYFSETEEISNKITEFRIKKGYLPTTLEEVGIIDNDEYYGPFYYKIISENEYQISFGAGSVGESKIFNSKDGWIVR